MRARNGESGQSLVLVAIGLVVLIGVLGLALDMGYLRYVRRELQTAADAAALAGAMDVYYGSGGCPGATAVCTAGKAASSENGFVDGANGVTVTINQPPQHGPYAGSSYPTYVEAIVTKTSVPTYFSTIFGVHSVTLSASSVAAGGNNCIYGLDTTSGGAINISLSIVNSSCGVVDNSNLGGLAALLCAPSIQLVGTNSLSFGGTCGSGFRAAKPVKITAPVADPFASLPAPAFVATPSACSGNAGFQTIGSGATVAPLPTYCGGTHIVGATGVTVKPGNYWGSPAFLIQNSTVTFLAGNYGIASTTAGTPGIQLSSHTFGGSTTVSFGSGTYTVYGGITDNDLFGSAVNWNSTAGSPSVFVIDGGGLHLTGNSGGSGSAGTSTGGVTFYNTGTTPAAGSVTTYGTVTSYFDFSAFCGASCQLSAPTTGTYAGILFFEDRSNTATTTCAAGLFGGFGSSTAGACFNGNISAGGGISHVGAYYFPNTAVSFNFNFGAGAPYSFLIAKDISWFLTFTFNRNYTNLPNGSPIKQGSAVLVQ